MGGLANRSGYSVGVSEEGSEPGIPVLVAITSDSKDIVVGHSPLRNGMTMGG